MVILRPVIGQTASPTIDYNQTDRKSALEMSEINFGTKFNHARQILLGTIYVLHVHAQ